MTARDRPEAIEEVALGAASHMPSWGSQRWTSVLDGCCLGKISDDDPDYCDVPTFSWEDITIDKSVPNAKIGLTRREF